MHKGILSSDGRRRAFRLACIVALLALSTGNRAGAQTILPAPTPASPANGSTGQPVDIVFTWGGSAGAAAYRLQVSTNPGFSGLVVDSTGISSTTARVSGLAENRTYYWRVDGYTLTLSSAWSAVWNFTTLLPPPPAPLLSSPANGATGLAQSLTLAWNASSGAATYELQLDTLTSFATPVLDASGLSGTSTHVGPLVGNKSYYWRVRAQNAGGMSAWSGTWQFTTAAVIVPPPAPLLSSPANGAGSQPQTVTLAWSAASGATLYHVELSASSSFATLELSDSTVGGTSRVAGPLAASTTYYWRVRGINTAGDGNWSAVWSFTTAAPAPPGTPALTGPADGSTNQSLSPLLTWSQASGASAYQVQVSTVSTFATLEESDSSITGLSRQVGPLQSGGLYYWRVRGLNAVGAGSWSTVWSFTTAAPALPGVPALAGPPDGSTGQSLTPLLSWNAASGATAYQVQVSTGMTFSTLEESDSSIAGLSRQVGPLQSGVLYYWRARGLNAAGAGNWSSVWSFATATAVIPGVPVLASPADGSTNQPLTPVLAWNAASGAATYQLQVSTASTFSSIVESDSAIPGTSRQTGALQEGTLYYWRVRGLNAVGAGNWSSVWSFTTMRASLPGVPTLASPANGSTNQSTTPTLAWNTASGASAYRLQVSGASTFSTIVESDSSITGTSRQTAALQGGITYYWRVRGLNAAGAGDWSAVWSLTTSMPPPPAIPTLGSPADGATNQSETPVLTWNAATGASAYHLQVSTATSFSSIVESDSAIAGTWHQTGALQGGAHYYWRVRGLNAAGAGNWSSAWSFTTSTNPLPGVPVLVSPVLGSSNQPLAPLLTWSAANGDSAYQLQVSIAANFASLVESDSSLVGTTRQVGALSSSTLYFWRVRGLNSVGVGGWSTVWSFTTSAPTAVVPALLSPQDGASNQHPPVILSWSPVSAALGYHLQLAADSEFSPILIDDSTIQTVSYSAALTAADTNFWWRVAAKTASGWGPFARPWIFTTPLSNPQMIDLSVTVGFPAKSNASDYTAADYRIVGLPGSSGAQVSFLLPGSPGTDWQMYWDNGGASNFLVKYAPDTTFGFSIGRGFWLVKKGGWTVSARVPAAPLNTAAQALIPLHAGWNLITDPFPTSVTWSQVQSANGIAGPIYSFSGGFATPGTLDPYNGYYYFNVNDSAFLRIPSGGVSTPRQAMGPAGIPGAVSGTWRVNLELTAGTYTDSAAWFGISPSATTGLNQLDFRKPHTVAQMPEVYFDRTSWDSLYPIFASDIRPPIDSGDVWPLAVQSTPGCRITLTFRGMRAIPPDLSVRIIDDAGETSVDLRNDSVCTFIAAAPVTVYRVVVGKTDFVRGVLSGVSSPGSFALERNYPNPFNPSTLIPVDAPASGDIGLSVYDILGRRVKVIFSGGVDRGRHLFEWDGSDDRGTHVASGVYLVRLEAVGGFTAVRRMLLLR